MSAKPGVNPSQINFFHNTSSAKTDLNPAILRPKASVTETAGPRRRKQAIRMVGSNAPPSRPQFESSLRARFGQHLLERGVVSKASMRDALSTLREDSVPLGRLALEAGYITMQEILDILNLQSGSSRRFGEIAVSLGYMEPENISELLEIQASRRRRLSDVLVELGAIRESELNAEIMDFVRTRL